MLLKSKPIFISLITLFVLTSILEFLGINFLYSTSILAFINFLFLQGLIVLLIFKIKLNFWETITFSIGLSILLLEIGGLLLNQLLPYFGINNPLSFVHLQYAFIIFNSLLISIAMYKRPDLTLKFEMPLISKLDSVMYLIPTTFPVIATLGAISLNNGGTNLITLILLAIIGGYTLFLILLRNKISEYIYPFAIFLMGLSLLFTTSLRSWYITGHDIEREFYVFNLTNTANRWDMAFYHDAYNACLSITILPTILTHLLMISDMYIFKVIFQILFALSPVLVYIIIKKFAKKETAFLSAFYFIAFPAFFNDMPMLNRQEIGFIFFGLIIYLMLSSSLSINVRRILFILFYLGIVISHYSTNYVTLALCFTVFYISEITSLKFIKGFFARFKNKFIETRFLTISILILMFLITYLWNFQFTKITASIDTIFYKTMDSIFVKSDNDIKSVDTGYSLLSFTKIDPQKELNNYIDQSIIIVKQINNSIFYNNIDFSKYKTSPISPAILSPTGFGNLLLLYRIPVFNIQSFIRSLSAVFLQLFVVIGVISILVTRKNKFYDLTYLNISIVGILFLILIVILPQVSVEYGLLRLFQQLLFILSLPIVITTTLIFYFLKEEYRTNIAAIIAVIFFLSLTGFLSHLTGIYYPQMTLDNSGFYYDVYYVNKADINADYWLKKNIPKKAIVQSDLSGSNKLLTFANIYSEGKVFPEVARKDAYVLLTDIKYLNETIVTINTNHFTYTSPEPFMDDYKNLIYSNGKKNVYK